MEPTPGSVEPPDEYDDQWTECWNCGGIGQTPGCFEDCCSGADCDPDDAEYCCAPNTCNVCDGDGGWRPIQGVTVAGDPTEPRQD